MKRCAIFAHYDAEDEVKRYILFHLRRLREDCDEVIFVTTARLGEKEIAKVLPHCTKVLVKDNVGFDFGMWKHALDQMDLTQWDELVLTNSSIFGPVFSLGEAFKKMAKDPCDFWGMTANYEQSWHLQSYFLVFRPPVFRSPVFRRFWDSVLPYRDKWHVIRSYEIGMTGFFKEAGFVARELVDLDPLPEFFIRREILGHSRRNPTCYYPVALLDNGMPYVKVELLRNNPGNIPLAPIFRALDRYGFDRSLIEFDKR